MIARSNEASFNRVSSSNIARDSCYGYSRSGEVAANECFHKSRQSWCHNDRREESDHSSVQAAACALILPPNQIGQNSRGQQGI